MPDILLITFSGRVFASLSHHGSGYWQGSALWRRSRPPHRTACGLGRSAATRRARRRRTEREGEKGGAICAVSPGPKNAWRWRATPEIDCFVE